MSITINVNTKVRSMAPIMIHATIFFPTFCLAPLLIISPPYVPVSVIVIIVIFFLLGRCVRLIITAVTDS